MKNFSLVLALFILFLAVSCDSGVKFNNPNDINSDTLAMGQEIVDMYSDVDSIDDLCTCFDMNSTAADSRVDCATIDWEGTTSTPCDPNPCAGISNSNGTCTASGSSYTC